MTIQGIQYIPHDWFLKALSAGFYKLHVTFSREDRILLYEINMLGLSLQAYTQVFTPYMNTTRPNKFILRLVIPATNK